MNESKLDLIMDLCFDGISQKEFCKAYNIRPENVPDEVTSLLRQAEQEKHASVTLSVRMELDRA